MPGLVDLGLFLLARFNIFETLSVERRELSYSSFLAFLLDPYGSHGVRDLFLRRFLQEAVRTSGSATTISAVDLDLMDLAQSEVKREYSNIDIFVIDKLNKLIVVIENKVDSKQHDGQLKKYREQTQNDHQEYKWLGILLSLQGEIPEHAFYVRCTYVEVRKVVLDILKRYGLMIGPAVKTSMQQYADLLGETFHGGHGTEKTL